MEKSSRYLRLISRHQVSQERASPTRARNLVNLAD
jgi:hypothetical protein